MPRPSSSNALLRERDRFIAFSVAAADAFMEVKTDGTIIYASGALETCLASTRGQIEARSIFELLSPAYGALLKAVMSQARHRGRGNPTIVRFGAHPADSRPVTIFAACLPEQPESVFLSLQTVRPRLIPARRSDSEIDQETGLLNAEGLTNLAGELLKANSEAGAELSLTLLELQGLADARSGLKPADESELLSHLVSLLRAISLDGTSAARLGGERFGLVHEGPLEEDALRSGLKEIPQAQNLGFDSVNIEMRSPELDEQDMAKTLVYTVRRFARQDQDFAISSITEGYESMLADTRRRLEKFRLTIKENRFDLMLQPIVELATRRVHHYEALTRLHDKVDGPSPFQFISFAEEMGVIGEFDLTVLGRVVEQLKHSRRHSGELSVAINVSGRSLQSEAFVDSLIEELLTCTDIRRQLMFEITESSEIRDLELTNRILQKIRRMGHSVCLDDFGAGASGFQYLRALKTDYVKIDGTYIQEALTSPNGRAFLKSMAELCRELNIETVGEFVETEEQARFLEEIGVRYGQGWLFGRPELRTSGSCGTFHSRQDEQPDDVHKLLRTAAG